MPCAYGRLIDVLENAMRSFLISAISVAGFLLLLCALASGPAAAQSACTTTYDCQGNSGCSGVMGGNITHRSITEYSDQASCDAAARRIMASQPLPTIQCSCGGSGTNTTSDLGSQFGQLVSTMTPQQQMGVAAGAVGTLMILQGLNGLMHPTPAPVDPAQQQRNLAAQQLNNSGIYLMKQKNYSGAINEFQQALAQTPNDANIKNNLAQAKQAQKNGVIAGQTSGTLGQLLGTAPATGGGPEVASNSSPLNMVNLNGSRSEPGTGFNLGGSAQTPPQSLQSQIDGALGNQPAAPAPAPANPAQAQAIDQIFNPSQAAPTPAPPPAQAQIDAEKNQVDDLFKGTGSTPASAQLAQQASSGQAAVSAKTDEEASAMAGRGFDSAAPIAVVPGGVASPTSAPPSSDVVDLRQTSPAANQPVVVADLKTPSSPAVAPEYPVTVMRAPISDATFTAPGSPIFDCAGDRALIKRLGSGLPAQDDAIQRTEEAIKAAKEDRAAAERKAKFAAVSTLLASASTAANWAQVSIARAGALRSNGIAADAANYKALARTKDAIEAMNRVVETSKKLTELMDKDKSELERSRDAHSFSNAGEVQSVAKILAEQMQIAKELYLAGAYDDVLERMATRGATVLAGPVTGATAAAAIHVLITSLDLYVNVQQAWNSAGEAEQAEHNLEIMRDEQRLVRGRIYELQQEVVSECAAPGAP
jgi:tetratricopeptide (TPR) repeat protein